MKDLITVFAYCPDNHRKKILQELLVKIQPLRNVFDIMVVSHSPISDLSHDMIDFLHYDSCNKLLTDFDIRKKHWYTNNIFDVNTTLVYPPSTHLAIYSLLYYTFNFAKFRGYKKIHCIEYDINLHDINLMYDVNNTLDTIDTVMFGDNTWIFGTYFAFTMNNFPEEYFIYDEEKIINELRNSETKMTEKITDKILTPNGRTILFKPLSKLDPTNIFQKVDNHINDELMWCVPLCDRNSDLMHFFVFNEKGGEYNINVIVNNEHIHIKTQDIGTWYLRPLGNINDITDILVLVNNKIKKHIILNEENKQNFKKHNFIKFI